MAEPSEKDKLPPEVLEGGDADLDEISVIVEPDKATDESLPEPATPIEGVPEVAVEIEEGEQTQKLKKYDPLFEASLKAATPRDVPKKPAGTEPSIIIQNEQAPLSPFEEEIDQAAKEAAGPIAIGYIKVVGEKPKEKGSAPPVPPPPPPGAKAKAKSIPPPPKPTMRLEPPIPPPGMSEEEEALKVPEVEIKQAEEEIRKAIKEVEKSLSQPDDEIREPSDSREEIEEIGEVEEVKQPPKKEEAGPEITAAPDLLDAAEEKIEDEGAEAEDAEAEPEFEEDVTVSKLRRLDADVEPEESTEPEEITSPEEETELEGEPELEEKPPIELPKQAPLAKPTPPPPPVRPSKQPPRPPTASKHDAPAIPPPPPPPKGLSMKSIVDHLPYIISIPDDEIPRGEPEKKEPAAVVELPLPEAVPKAKKKWFEEIFDEDYIRLLPPLTELNKKREINFLQKTLGLEQGSVILDLACGPGIHCIGLAEKGYQMVGLDLSFAMLAIASEDAQMKGCKINFIQKDLREIDFKEVFEGAYCVGSSFGYFDDDDNEKVIAGVYSALKPGGMFLLEVDNRDYVLRQTPGLLWFEGDGLVCMEETSFDFITSRLKVKRTLLFEDGGKKMHNYSIRLYSIHELGRMLHKAGFRVDSAGGHRAAPKTFVGEDSSRIIILAQKRYADEI